MGSFEWEGVCKDLLRFCDKTLVKYPAVVITIVILYTRRESSFTTPFYEAKY